LLESAGFEVTAHTSSLRALESFQANPQHFDLLIADSKMPDMTGLELVDRIMAIRPTLPILMVSDTSKSVTVDLLKMRGVTRVLRKPRDPAVLVEVVREILDPGPV
jgi:CheY-like chemotaxis protein